MKKKNLIISGLMLLGCVASVATYALSDSMPGISTYADAGVAPTSVFPANDAVVGSNVGVSSLYLEFPGSGDSGYDVTTEEGLDIIVKKDGETILTLPVNDRKYVNTDRNWINRVNVSLGTTLKEPGVYTVEVPAGIATMSSFGQSGASTSVTGAYTWSFKIEAAFSYTVSPRPGGEASLGELAHIVITYEEGTEIKVNSGKATLYNFASGKTTSQTTYTAKAEGNVLTLTADTPSKITGSTQTITVNYDYIEIPAGMLTLSQGDISYDNQKLTIGNYAPRAVAASDFTLIPDPSTPGLSIEDLNEVTVVLREGLTASNLKPAATSLAFTVNPLPYSGTYCYQYTFKSVSEDGRTIVGVRKDPTSNSFTNTTQYCEAGPCVVRFAANQVTVAGTTTKNAAIDIPAWTLAGIEYAPFYTNPLAGNVVTSISGLTVSFPQPVTVADENAKIAFYHDGEFVKEVPASATTTAAAKIDGAGSASVAYTNLFKTEDGQTFTEPGTYTFHVPAGAYKQKSNGYLNQEADINVYIGRECKEVVKYPVPATFSGTTSNLQCTPAAGSDLNEFTNLTLTYPEGTYFEMIPGYENKLSTCGATSVGASPALNNNQANGQSFNNTTGVAWGSVDIKDNVIVFNLLNPYRIATAKNRATCMWIAKGIFIAHVPNGEGGYDLYPNVEMDNYYQPFEMYQGLLAKADVKENGTATLDYYAEAGQPNVILNNELGSIIYSGYQEIYLTDANDKALPAPTATLTNEAGEVIAKYTGVAVNENYGLSSANVQFNTTTDLSNLEPGIYTFTIAQGCLQGGSKTTSNALTVFNSKPFSYTIENFVINPVEFESVIKRGIPSAEEFSLNESFGGAQGRGFGMAIVQLEAAKGVTVNPDCTEKVQLYYGETLLAEVPVKYDEADGTGIMPYGMSYSADEDVDWGSTNNYLVMFNPMGGEQFNQLGSYTIKFPEGAFLSNGLQTTAADLNYTLVEDQTEWKYNFTPASGSNIDDGLTSIVLTVENAQLLEAEKDCATLVDPDGEIVPWASSFAGYDGDKSNTVKWIVKPGFNNWKIGEYTFTLKAKTIAVNGFLDEVDPTFPQEDLKVVYGLTTGVSLVGVDAADSYTVYTVNGQVVLLNGTFEQVSELPAGLYIVNGKKALLRK